MYQGGIPDLSQHLSRWAAIENLPKEFAPPIVDLTDSMFTLPSPHSKKMAKKLEGIKRRKAPKGRKKSKDSKRPKSPKTRK